MSGDAIHLDEVHPSESVGWLTHRFSEQLTDSGSWGRLGARIGGANVIARAAQVTLSNLLAILLTSLAGRFSGTTALVRTSCN